jgi:hypothetical protein
MTTQLNLVKTWIRCSSLQHSLHGLLSNSCRKKLVATSIIFACTNSTSVCRTLQNWTFIFMIFLFADTIFPNRCTSRVPLLTFTDWRATKIGFCWSPRREIQNVCPAGRPASLLPFVSCYPFRPLRLLAAAGVPGPRLLPPDGRNAAGFPCAGRSLGESPGAGHGAFSLPRNRCGCRKPRRPGAGAGSAGVIEEGRGRRARWLRDAGLQWRGWRLIDAGFLCCDVPLQPPVFLRGVQTLMAQSAAGSVRLHWRLVFVTLVGLSSHGWRWGEIWENSWVHDLLSCKIDGHDFYKLKKTEEKTIFRKCICTFWSPEAIGWTEGQNLVHVTCSGESVPKLKTRICGLRVYGKIISTKSWLKNDKNWFGMQLCGIHTNASKGWCGNHKVGIIGTQTAPLTHARCTS